MTPVLKKHIVVTAVVTSLLISLLFSSPSTEGEVPDHIIFIEDGGYHSAIFNEMIDNTDTDVKIIIGDVRVGQGGKNLNNTTEEFRPIDVYIMTSEQLADYGCGEDATDFNAARSKENLTENELIFTLEYYTPSNESEYYFVIDNCDNGRSTDYVPGSNDSWIRVEYGIYDGWDIMGEGLEDIIEGALLGVGILLLVCAGSIALIIVLLIVLIIRRR